MFGWFFVYLLTLSLVSDSRHAQPNFAAFRLLFNLIATSNSLDRALFLIMAPPKKKVKLDIVVENGRWKLKNVIEDKPNL